MALSKDRSAVVIDAATYRALFTEVRASRSALEMAAQRNAYLAEQLELLRGEGSGLQQALEAMSRLEAQLDRVLASTDEGIRLVQRLKAQELRIEQIEAKLRLMESGGYQSKAQQTEGPAVAHRVAGLEGRLDGLAERLADMARIFHRMEDVETEVVRTGDRLTQIGGQLDKWRDFHSATVEQGALIVALLGQNNQLFNRENALDLLGGGLTFSALEVPTAFVDEPPVVEVKMDCGMREIAGRDMLSERSAGLVPEGIIRKIRHELKSLGLA